MGFLENQIVAREMTNLTPIQLEEFESVFRHFDRDMSNTLHELEFSAALASLGLVYDEEEMHEQFVDISTGKGYVTFEQFIRFMVAITEDQNTAEQVFQSFKEVADGKVSSSFPHVSDFCIACLSIQSLSTALKSNPLAAIRNGARPSPLSYPRRAGGRSPYQHAFPQRPRLARRPSSTQIRLHQLHGKDDAGRTRQSGREEGEPRCGEKGKRREPFVSGSMPSWLTDLEYCGTGYASW